MDVPVVGGTLDDLARAVDAVEEIPGGRLRGPGEPASGIRTASYLLTINPNVYVNPLSADYDAAHINQVHHNLLNAARALVRQLREEKDAGYIVSEFIEFNDNPRQLPPPGIDNYVHYRDFIDVRPFAHNEVGARFGRLHQHLVLIIRHTSHIRLNIPAIKAFYDNYLGLNCYVFVRTFRTLENVLDYIAKNDMR